MPDYTPILNWIDATIKEHEPHAVKIDHTRFPRIQHYFPMDMLNRVRVRFIKPVPSDALIGLLRVHADLTAVMPAMDPPGMTLDHLVFIWPGMDASLTQLVLFHELVHVVQFSKMGRLGFTASYATDAVRAGYTGVRLEQTAFKLHTRFGSDQTPFDAWQATVAEIPN